MTAKRLAGRTSADRTDTALVGSINAFIADSYLLLAKTQACHWNATGANFLSLHHLTEAQYTELFAAIDLLAERVRAIGGEAPHGLADMLSRGRLAELEDAVSTDQATRLLAEDNRTLARFAADLAEDADESDDLATHDLLVARIAAHERAAWLLCSQLD